MLIITHLNGPLSGRRDQFPDVMRRVVFGRSADCTIVYPPETVAVGREHFALTRVANHWCVDVFPGHFVSLDGTPVEQSEVLVTGATICLGSSQGPSLRAEVTSELTSTGLPITELQESVVSSQKLARRALWRASLSVAGSVLLVIGVLYFYSIFFVRNAELSRIITSVSDQQRQYAARSISTSTTTALAKSVFLVALRDKEGRLQPEGTAWPISDHLLATNAHVAELRETLKPGESMIVRAPGAAGDGYKVIEDKMHPAYKAFAQFVNQDPLVLQAFRGNLEMVDLNDASYDVAVLRIEETLPTGTILKLATRAELQALANGSPVATAGYPLENIVGSATAALEATPEVRVGVISSMTDFFSLPADYEHRQLIHDNIPAVGGQSGSPIVDPQGDVIGLLNSGNIFSTDGRTRQPSAALVNYAQRVDLLQDLLSGEADSKLSASKDYWIGRVKSFERAEDAIIPDILAGLQADRSKLKPTLISKDDQQIKPGDPKAQLGDTIVRAKSQSLEVDAGAEYTFIAYAQKSESVGLLLSANGSVVASETGMRWYPTLTYKPPSKGTIEMIVVAPGDDAVEVRVRVYRWDRTTENVPKS